MMKVTVDDSLRSKLKNFRSPLELYDESGRVVGYFTPAADPAMYEEVESPTSQRELDRRSQEGGGRPVAEILEGLKRQG